MKNLFTSLLLLLTGAAALAQTAQPPASTAQATNMVASGVYISPSTLGDFWNFIVNPAIQAGGGGNTNALTPTQNNLLTNSMQQGSLILPSSITLGGSNITTWAQVGGGGGSSGTATNLSGNALVQTTNIALATVAPYTNAIANAVTNDPTVEAFVNSRSISKDVADDVRGCVQEITKRGYRSSLVDIWPLHARYGTNQNSLYGVPWTGWNQAVFGDYTNPLNTIYYPASYSITNPMPCVTVLPLRTNVTAFTLAVTLRDSIAGNYNDSRAYLYTACSVRGTVGDHAFVGVTGNPGIVVVQGTNAIDWNSAQFGSNVILSPVNGAFETACTTMSRRTTWIVSYDGAGHYSAWHNSNPCAFPTNGYAQSSFTYNCPLTVTNAMNQIVLGFDYMWASNGFAAGSSGGNESAQAFCGSVDTVMLFSQAAETNTILTNTMLGSPLANCAYAASSWLNQSDTYVTIDGTSMMRPNYLYNSVQTNEIGQAYFARHPEWPCVSDYSKAGKSITSMQPASQGSWVGSSFGFPYLHVTQLPRGKVKRVILITDHPRNDINVAKTNSFNLFNQWYAPLRPYLTDLVQISDGNQTPANDGANFYLGMTNCYLMQNSPVITRWIPEFKYVEPGGILNGSDTNLTTANHNDGFNQAYAWYNCQQWAGLIDGIPMQPFAPQSPAGVTNTVAQPAGAWPTYTVTLSGSPCFWTNYVATVASFNYIGGAVTGISLNGVAQPFSPLGGKILLQPFDVIGFTNTTPPSAAYTPQPPL